jgi:hypothetical protein
MYSFSAIMSDRYLNDVHNDTKTKNKNNNILISEAREILDKNWNERFTIPSPVLYPHQWSWDSAFIALGNSYFHTDRSTLEMQHLFNAQWKGGMVPHIVFNKDAKTYFPASDFYRSSETTDKAPRHVQTSCMTQPPVHAITCFYVYKNASAGEPKEKANRFLKWVYPRLYEYHKYLMTARDPEKSGTVTIFHPWESGLDNLPVWDEPLTKLDIEQDKMPKFQRLDVLAVGGAKETRTSDERYSKLIYLADLMRCEYRYEEGKMNRDFPFRIKDIVCTVILYVANKYLLKIGKILNEKVSHIEEWIDRTEQNFYRYFSPTQNLATIEADDFYNFDLVRSAWLKKRTVISLLPIFAGIIPEDKIKVLVKWINHAHYCGANNCFAPVLPSTEVLYG